jgi:hypothetical protein
LMAFLFSYVISRGESSIPHKETHHVASGLFSIFDSGALLTTIIGWTQSIVAIYVLSWTHCMWVFGSAGNAAFMVIVPRWEITLDAGLHAPFLLHFVRLLTPCLPPDAWR